MTRSSSPPNGTFTGHDGSHEHMDLLVGLVKALTSCVHGALTDDSEHERADEENDPDRTQPEQALENEPHDRQHRPNDEQDDDHHPHTLRLRSSTIDRR